MLGTGEFVYVNQDGSVRELSPDEQAYLAEDFAPGDGGRPYIKDAFESRDGWGSVSGFLPRSSVPRGVSVEPVNPDYVPPVFDSLREMIEDDERIRNIPQEKQFELLRQFQLERQRAREKLARHPDCTRSARDSI